MKSCKILLGEEAQPEKMHVKEYERFLAAGFLGNKKNKLENKHSPREKRNKGKRQWAKCKSEKDFNVKPTID